MRAILLAAVLAGLALAASPARAQLDADLPPEYRSSVRRVVWERIQLHHMDARMAALIFGGYIMPTEADLLGLGRGPTGYVPGMLNQTTGGSPDSAAGARALLLGGQKVTPMPFGGGGVGAFAGFGPGTTPGGFAGGGGSALGTLIQIIADPSSNSLLVDP